MNKTILLLGASNDVNGELSQMAIDRLECAYSIYANNSDIRFLCTGGFGEHFNTTQTPHAEYLRQWLLVKGIKCDEVLPHIISSNTYEDIYKLKEVINSISIGLLIIVTSDFHVERVHNDFTPLGIDAHFDTIITVEDSIAPKPSAEPILAYLNKTGVKPQEALYIGDTLYDRECAVNAGVDFGVAMWGCHSIKQIHATYYFETPKDVLNVFLK